MCLRMVNEYLDVALCYIAQTTPSSSQTPPHESRWIVDNTYYWKYMFENI